MWSALSKLFSKNNKKVREGGDKEVEMDRGDNRPDIDMEDAYDTRQAKQRAAIKWLLSKAFNNKVPENLREPFYKDHENQEKIKPQIVGTLANAEMYCLALGNIYSDPNYHNLNHWSILQTLARKGVYVAEPSDGSQLTETTLIQTNPLRINAHMAVMEAVMVLYAKEVVTPDRVLAGVQRFSHNHNVPSSVPENYEQGLMLWVRHTCEALRKRIEQETDSGVTNGGGEGDRLNPPALPVVKDFKDLCDGVALAALISYYCPDELPWMKLHVSYLPTVSESLHNLTLVQSFCHRCLPASVFHMMPEDITYMRGSMKLNLIVFLADLFNVLEIHPVKCVRYPGMDKSFNEGFPARNAHGVVHKRNLPQSVMSPIPDLRSGLNNVASSFQVTKSTPTHVPLRKANSYQQSMSEMSEDSLRRGSDDSFVVYKSRNIPTLSSVIQDESLISARLRVAKEKQNNDSKAEERGEQFLKIAAGKPSNWDENKKPSYSGRRSRKNSITDDSQLTIENFGGSQDNINFIGRNTDKEVGVHTGRKISTPAEPIVPIENPAVRSSKQDNCSSFQLGYDNGCEKQDDDCENYKLKRQLSSDVLTLNNKIHDKENIISDMVDGEIASRLSFANLKQKLGGEQAAIQLVYMQHDKEEPPAKSSFLNKNGATNGNSEKKTTFATLPNTTTWQQQSSSNVQPGGAGSDDGGGDEGSSGNHVMASQLNDIRLKLEEKRRHIESEKRRMEVIVSKQRQKVGKAAFLQAVTKGKGNILKNPNEAESSSAKVSDPCSSVSDSSAKAKRPLTLQEISNDVSNVERKWLDGDQPFVETKRTPDIENMDLEQYQQSIAQMNTNLYDIQADIQRLATQQNQIQISQQQHQQLPQQHQQLPQQHQHLFMQQQNHPIQPYQQQQQQIPQYGNQQPYNAQPYQQGAIYNPLQSYSSAPHIPQAIYTQQIVTSPRVHPEQSHFYLHDQAHAQPHISQSPIAPQRRTWAQQNTESYQQPEIRTWGKPQNPSGFLLHNNTDRYQENSGYQQQNSSRYNDNSVRYQNGGEDYPLNRSNSHPGFTLSQQHIQQQLFPGSHTSPSTSPQHRNLHKQISQLMDESKRNPVSLQQIDREPNRKSSSVTHAPIPAPSVDDMEPQSISFIGNSADDQLSEGISKLNITSGTRTYRIPSPTRPLITRNSFQAALPIERIQPPIQVGDQEPENEKGFYISFDNEQPKRPKPPLRTKKGSPRKEHSFSEIPDSSQERQDRMLSENQRQLQRELDLERRKKEEEMGRRREDEMLRQREEDIARRREEMRNESLRDHLETSQEKVAGASAIIIGTDLKNPDPDLVDERERKKEKIMLLSLQRRQQQEEAKQRKEQEAHTKREKEKEKEEERQRKKEEQLQRRAAILEQYKLKKAIDEAEREGKTLDKEYMSSLKPVPKMRAKGGATRPRPKTIHIDSGSVEMAEGMLPSSRGKKGSTSNLTANNYSSNTMKRDYYRGSQDNLANGSRIGSGLLYKDSPDDSRGMSPCHSANQTLGRRGSYKTSRDPSPAQVRGRPKYPTYKGRKSSSMMNLYGSSTDQDSLAYRYGDTDSGLGRATPPRRVPSPGMGPMRHLPSPSGPGSLPGFMTKRRMFDDGSSDISSTPSSMMDYTGPRLYKQPTTKSNRGIMLNAVEYCVFPGVVNKEAKRRVLEEMNRSEAKHFLILFRDAGCQFRALYSYCPEGEDVIKMYGTGPKQVNDRMFDKFFKYNSGGKCFSQVHTKHLTVTIDAFTIHNSLWQGKKVNLPSKKDMTLVI